MSVENRIVSVCKAEPTTKPVPTVHLCIEAPLPPYDNTAPRRVYVEDARSIVTAMATALPQGTIDQVLILLLELSASQLRVSLPDPRVGGG